VDFSPWNCLSADDTPPGVTPEEEAKRAKETLGRRISKRRRGLGLPQDELASRAGVDRSHMSSIETGKTEPGVWTLMKIARELETTASNLLSGLKSSPASPDRTASQRPAKTRK
jgi:transcriptional regulator with XRE-family HTH domain